MALVHLFSGYIGFGKTTIAKQIELETGALRITPDDIIKEKFGTTLSDDFMTKAQQVEQFAWGQIAIAIRNGQDVIYDAGYWTPETRKYATEKVQSLGGQPVWHQIQCDISVAKQRVMARSKDKNELAIDEKFFEENLANYSPIEIDECLDVIHHNNSTPQTTISAHKRQND